jgi:hypothetical protein
MGYRFKRTNPTFTNLSAVETESASGVGGAQDEREANMAINYAKTFNRRVTPQSQPIPGSTQVPNSAGGNSWQVDDWTRLDRFLILGAEGGTYYITERDLVKQNHDALVRCIEADGVRAVNRIVEISDAGRAPKNDPAIFALQGRAHVVAGFRNRGRTGRSVLRDVPERRAVRQAGAAGAGRQRFDGLFDDCRLVPVGP